MNRRLETKRMLPSIETLQNRIYERFPERSLSNVAQTLVNIAREAQEQAQAIARPNIWLRVGIGFLIFVIVTIIFAGLLGLDLSFSTFTIMDVATLFESIINDIIFISAGIYFLVNIENRRKRGKTLEKLTELRTLAHVIDMHQLTKDPERMLSRGTRTKSSPKESMTAFELSRYLDYCSEMLSMIGKIAMLYVQDFDDEVVSGNVNEIETLTTGLSRKIWQKIMVIYQYEESLHGTDKN